MGLWDTHAPEYYERLRPLPYSQMNVILLCFNIVCPQSFENISNNWNHEISHFCPHTPSILIGTKSDLREDRETVERLRFNELSPILYEQGIAKASHPCR